MDDLICTACYKNVDAMFNYIDVNKYNVFLDKFVKFVDEVIYKIIVTLDQWKGAFLNKVVPLFKKLYAYIMLRVDFYS